MEEMCGLLKHGGNLQEITIEVGLHYMVLWNDRFAKDREFVEAVGAFRRLEIGDCEGYRR